MSRRRWVAGIASITIMTGMAIAVPAATTVAAPPPSDKIGGDRALGNGLGRLLAQETAPSARRAGGVRIDQDAVSVRDDQGRVLIQVTPHAGVPRKAFRTQVAALGLSVEAVDEASGTVEGYAPLSAVAALAALPDTGTVAQTIKPGTRIGKATSQGVGLQRVDRVQARGGTGRGITIAALSDSYDVATTTVLGDPLTIHAADDVASGDLPGTGNPRHPRPVVVLEEAEDPDSSADEGRAMLQIAHDIAPASKLCFASAFNSEIGFADNIRRLADPDQGCGADVIVDDVIYFDEPMFSDGILSDAVDDVAAQGVHYFSSAGNNGEAQSWDSRVRLLPAAPAIEGTNLDFSEVDPALYDGGLQDLDPGRGTDVAQNLTVGPGGGSLFDLQWDDPVDLNGASYGDPIFEAAGEITDADPEPSFAFTPTPAQVGSTVEFRVDAIPSGETDLILSVDAPDGTNLGTIDTGTSPEVLAVKLSQAGTYTITVAGFAGDTGDFQVTVRPVVAPSKVTTDFNVLVFDPDGNYLGAVADLNPLSGRPIEIAGLDGLGDIQLVISRAGTGPVKATHLRNVLAGDVYFTEYSDPVAPAIFGHPTARGATAVAAYDPFRPYLPEFYTSPGGDLQISFDSAGNRFPRPQTRRVPQVAGADRGNTTFFVVDDLRDPDDLPNFGGTSASAPHVAAIAALVLQRAGGRDAYSPRGLRRHLQRSTFAHDLDPAKSKGRAGGLTIRAKGPQGYEQDVVPGPMNDPDFFTLKYRGRVPLRSITFFGRTASPTARGSGYWRRSDGIVFDPRPFGTEPSYRTSGFPFTIGATRGGLSADSVDASFSVPGVGEAEPGQYSRMRLRFDRLLRFGQGLRFGVDRDLAVSGFGGANEGNGADELGGAVFLPSGIAVEGGMRFVARRADGRVIVGEMKNRLGRGYTPVDGYGVVDAYRAVFAR